MKAFQFVLMLLNVLEPFQKMKTKSAAKSSKVTENKEKKPLAVETSKRTRNKTTVSKTKSSAKKDSSSDVTIPDKHAKTIDSPEVYKNVHNIGRRRATERVVSYKETEIAFSLKDSFWSDAKLDLGTPSRNESTQVRATQEKSSSMSHHLDENSSKGEDRTETKLKPDKLPVVRSELRSAKTAPSEPRAEGSASSSGKRGSVFDSQKITNKTPRGRKSPILRHASQVIDVKKSNDDEVEALLSAAVSSDGDDSEDSKRQSSSKRRLQLSSKKRAELSFLARGVSSSGCSDVFNRRQKGGDQPQYVRAKRTASLNAGAIMSLMLQKEEPSVSRRDRMECGDSDDDSDDTSSNSSDSVDSTYLEYISANRQTKRTTKVQTSTTGALASASASTPANSVASRESMSSLKDKEKVGFQREKHISSTESVTKEMPASSDEVVEVAKQPTEKEKASSPVRKTGSPKQSMNFLKGSTIVSKDTLSLDAKVTKKSSEAKQPPPVATTTKYASPSPKNLGSDVTEGKVKRKRKEFEEYVPVLGPGKRMASLNAQVNWLSLILNIFTYLIYLIYL